MSTTELNGIDAEEYLRGQADGFAWGREYATPDELRDVAQNFEPGHASDPYWRGFVAGAEEILDERAEMAAAAT
jgi:hypothetical protein